MLWCELNPGRAGWVPRRLHKPVVEGSVRGSERNRVSGLIYVHIMEAGLAAMTTCMASWAFVHPAWHLVPPPLKLTPFGTMLLLCFTTCDRTIRGASEDSLSASRYFSLGLLLTATHFLGDTLLEHLKFALAHILLYGLVVGQDTSSIHPRLVSALCRRFGERRDGRCTLAAGQCLCW